MPPTLISTKRKFHNLLESLTSRPSNSRSTASPTFPPYSGAGPTDPPSKRARLTPHSSTHSSLTASIQDDIDTTDRTSTSDSSKFGIKINARTAAILKRKEQERRDRLKEEAQYNPWSAEGFLKRLKTFSDLTLWTPGKPDEINEVTWAKRGWTCDGLNRVACKRGCEARVVISLRPKRRNEDGAEIEGSEDYSEELSEELVKRYQALVQDGHNEGCLWRVGRECAQDIYRIGVVRGEVWQRELRERYQSFEDLEDRKSLPVQERLEHPIDVHQIARYLEADFFDSTSPVTASSTTDPQPPLLSPTTLALSLTGWQAQPATTASSTPTATCATCFRRIGLWLYIKTLNESQDDAMKLDLLNSHRHYCPWISGISQAMPKGTFEGLPAYEVLLRVIGQWAGMRARARKSGARVVGRELVNGVEGEVRANGDAGEGEGDEERPVSAKSREEICEEDRKRFARFRELTRIMGLKKRRRPESSAGAPPSHSGGDGQMNGVSMEGAPAT